MNEIPDWIKEASEEIFNYIKHNDFASEEHIQQILTKHAANSELELTRARVKIAHLENRIEVFETKSDKRNSDI